ncbi:hypothetical protein [Anatilimnocola aggregata]|nr:hypothetical protein [Anatilimnocola aggregata]
MRPSETIKFRSAEPLSSTMCSELANRGWHFTAASDELIIFEAEYSPGVSLLPLLEATLTELQWQPKVYYSVSPNFEPVDFQQAELAMVSAPDEYAPELTKQTRQCQICHKRIKPRQLVGTINSLKSSQPCFVLNGEAFVVNSTLAAVLTKSDLTGYKLVPVDDSQSLFQISATRDLLEQVIQPSETIDYQGQCAFCGWPQFKIYFGPGRIRRGDYAGEDFVWSSFFGGELLMSHKALYFFKTVKANVTPIRPVVLH